MLLGTNRARRAPKQGRDLCNKLLRLDEKDKVNEEAVPAVVDLDQ